MLNKKKRAPIITEAQQIEDIAEKIKYLMLTTPNGEIKNDRTTVSYSALRALYETAMQYNWMD